MKFIVLLFFGGFSCTGISCIPVAVSVCVAFAYILKVPSICCGAQKSHMMMMMMICHFHIPASYSLPDLDDYYFNCLTSPSSGMAAEKPGVKYHPHRDNV